jgi:hypothetical protein
MTYDHEVSATGIDQTGLSTVPFFGTSSTYSRFVVGGLYNESGES